jgi:DNA-binding IclR family transcriptional regulator
MTGEGAAGGTGRRAGAAGGAPVAGAAHPRRQGRPGRPRGGAAGGAAGADRALDVLELFSEERPWLRVGDVAGELGVSDSTASRLLARLEARGYVERHPASGLFALGPRILTMAGVAMNHSDLRRAGLEEMHRLVHTLGLGANLAVQREGGVFYLGNLDGRNAPRYYTLLGRRYPLHATALGKVLLAWRDPQDLPALLGAAGPEGALQRYTPSTVGDVPTLLARLEGVRTRGYATEIEELAMGRACVAAPIRDRHGAVIAGLSVSGSVRIMDLPEREAELAAAAVDAAMHVSERLGFVMAPMPERTVPAQIPDWQAIQGGKGGEQR